VIRDEPPYGWWQNTSQNYRFSGGCDASTWREFLVEKGVVRVRLDSADVEWQREADAAAPTPEDALTERLIRAWIIWAVAAFLLSLWQRYR